MMRLLAWCVPTRIAPDDVDRLVISWENATNALVYLRDVLIARRPLDTSL